jgi:hypothetical protein
MTRYITNPDTGRKIRVGGTLFCKLLYDRYDFIQGEFVRRAWTPDIVRRYVYNVVTHRRVLVDGRQYNTYIQNGWEVNNQNQIFPPDHLWELPQENARRENHILPTYENLMAIHGERLANLNVTLCRECFIAIKIEEGEFCNEHKP